MWSKGSPGSSPLCANYGQLRGDIIRAAYVTELEFEQNITGPHAHLPAIWLRSRAWMCRCAESWPPDRSLEAARYINRGYDGNSLFDDCPPGMAGCTCLPASSLLVTQTTSAREVLPVSLSVLVVALHLSSATP